MEKQLKMTLRKKLMWLSAFSVFFTAFIISTISAVSIVKRVEERVKAYKEILIEERKNQIKGYVEMAAKQIEKLPLEGAKEAVRAMRYGDKGYISVHDYDNIMLVHPDPALEGKDQTNLKDHNGVYIVRELTKAGRENEGGGFITYSWKIPGQDILRPKLAFAKAIPQYQWVVVTGIYIDDIDEAVVKERNLIKKDIINNISFQLLIAFALAIFLMLASKFFVTKYITGPIESITRTMQGFKNDLTVSVPVISNDEVGELASWFNDLIGKLRHSVLMVSGVTNDLHTHAGVISSNMQHQSSFAVQLASSVTEITSTMEELSSSAAQIAQHSQGVVAHTDKTLNETRQGAAEVEHLTAKIDNINRDMQANLAEIVALGRKSKEINKIMEIINNIANQTRLIAFNAALEAASAGEVGKRFGVVAVEIRRLADSVVESTAEIESKITEILDAVNRLVMSSEKTSVMMQESQDASIHTVEMLMNMVDGVEQAADSARQISLSTQQQQIASSQVLLAIREIDQGVRQSTDSARQSNLITGELAELAGRLKKLVKTFKIESQKISSLNDSVTVAADNKVESKLNEGGGS
ncbi:MAG: methyl-accepting chemotaxis protein [Desulfamplus sp.]|nr:methyl-accepting chemotaxis protein [Desulfamplus sp.]MBF0413999.1 methyl-accepting chemotaxis protein [Desulfamplus sp.]